MLPWLELFGICTAILYVIEIRRKEAFCDMGPPVRCVLWPSAVPPSATGDFFNGWQWGRWHALTGRGPHYAHFRLSLDEFHGYCQGYHDPEASWWL